MSETCLFRHWFIVKTFLKYQNKSYISECTTWFMCYAEVDAYSRFHVFMHGAGISLVTLPINHLSFNINASVAVSSPPEDAHLSPSAAVFAWAAIHTPVLSARNPSSRNANGITYTDEPTGNTSSGLNTSWLSRRPYSWPVLQLSRRTAINKPQHVSACSKNLTG